MSNCNSPMNLAPKASVSLPRRSVRAEAGYAMAALLVGMSVMAVMLSVAMPTWSQMIRRDKEEELIFRGTQYARAINQYQRKFANASPANLDLLIEQRMLRKKFRDPFSPDKDGAFQLLYLSNQAPGSRGGAFGAVGGAAAGRGAGTGTGPVASAGPGAVPGPVTPGSTSYGTTPSGGIVGVTSKNTGASIKVYKGKKRYNEWQFVGMEQSMQAGGAGGPGGVPGGRGGPQRGGRGGREGASGPGGFGSGGGRGGQGGFGGRGGDGGGFPGGGGRGPVPSPPR